MNRSKSAAVLMLVGAFAAGVGTPVVFNAVRENRSRNADPECPQPRSANSSSANSYRERYAQLLGLAPEQTAAVIALDEARNRAVGELYAIPRAKTESLSAATKAFSDSIWAVPRAKADSIRKATSEKQNALLTPEQRAKLEERKAVMKQRDAERDAQRLARQARCAQQQTKQSAGQSKAPPTKTKSNNH